MFIIYDYYMAILHFVFTHVIIELGVVNMNVVIKANDKLVEQIRNYYAADIDFNNKIPHTKFVVTLDDLKVIAYQSNKVMFQGQRAKKDASLWQEGLTTSESKSNKNNCFIAAREDEHIGSDEVGTGDYFGPVVVCASYVNQEIINQVAHLNLQDSKKINDTMIRCIAKELRKIVPHYVYCLDNVKYNKAIETDNANSIKAKMHNYALRQVTKMIKKQPTIIVDQFCLPKTYYNYLKDTKDVIRDIHFETKAEDKYLAVAIASIIARDTFLDKMDDLSDIVGFRLQKGASDIVDTQGAKIVLDNGFEMLDEVAKVHFSNTLKIKDKLKQ